MQARHLMAALIGFTSLPVFAAGTIYNICIAEYGYNNPLYHNLARPVSRLVCDNSPATYRPTLADMYADNWRLIKIEDGSGTVEYNQRQSQQPVYYFQRTTVPKDEQKVIISNPIKISDED
ncbi:MAG: hypothetical protein V7744_00560 [Pseudomonadales bacterium]